MEYEYAAETDRGHGRLETRRYWIAADLRTLPDTGRWKGLRSIGMAGRECLENGKHTVERRYFLNSIPADAGMFAGAVREHRGIENRLHWRLDVTFKADLSRIRKGNAPAIPTGIRHLCMNLFQKEPSKTSLNKKRLTAAWSDTFRSKVLLA